MTAPCHPRWIALELELELELEQATVEHCTSAKSLLTATKSIGLGFPGSRGRLCLEARYLGVRGIAGCGQATWPHTLLVQKGRHLGLYVARPDGTTVGASKILLTNNNTAAGNAVRRCVGAPSVVLVSTCLTPRCLAHSWITHDMVKEAASSGGYLLTGIAGPGRETGSALLYNGGWCVVRGGDDPPKLSPPSKPTKAARTRPAASSKGQQADSFEVTIRVVCEPKPAATFEGCAVVAGLQRRDDRLALLPAEASGSKPRSFAEYSVTATVKGDEIGRPGTPKFGGQYVWGNKVCLGGQVAIVQRWQCSATGDVVGVAPGWQVPQAHAARHVWRASNFARCESVVDPQRYTGGTGGEAVRFSAWCCGAHAGAVDAHNTPLFRWITMDMARQAAESGGCLFAKVVSPSEGACSVPLLGAGWEVVEGEAAGAAKGRKAKRDASGKPKQRGSKRRRK